MGRRTQELSKSEWGIMDALWSRGRGTATDLQKSLEATKGWAYSTVKTMLDRLVEKGYVKARRVGNVYEYSAKVQRPAAVNRVVDDIADRLLAGSVAPFMQRLIEKRRLTPEEAGGLRTLLDQYDADEAEEKGDES